MTERSEIFTDDTGQRIWVHHKDVCKGTFCPIHNPSAHHMRELPRHIRLDCFGLVERICSHGIGHPDPDSLAFFSRIGHDWMGIHGCDGCCGGKI